MPVDLNGKGRHVTRERDSLEIRRTKGEASCAECRRLKLRCDRKTPCTSCVRRGCELICPNGTLAAGQGSRFVLADTDRLHKKLLEMSKRIRQLEDALQIVQAGQSVTKHPLLSDELLAIKSGVDFNVGTESPGNDEDDPADGLSSDLGTLSISESGAACFMGRVSSEALLMIINESLSDQMGQQTVSNDYPQHNYLPEQIMSISEAFPFAPVYLPKDEILKSVEARLPTYARATALAEAYLANVAWFHCAVDREQIFEELIPSVYKSSNARIQRRNSRGEVNDDDDVPSDYVHRLALLLSVLAGGAAGDLTLPIANDEADLYIHLARAALSLNSVFVGTSMENVQTIILLAVYDFRSCQKENFAEPLLKMLSFGFILASSIGLHRDPARWKMEPKLVQRRRRLFWEIFTADKWKSLESGRPAVFNSCEVDCQFPEDKEATLGEDGSVIPGFWRWKYRFTKEVVAPIAEQLCLARPVKYSELLELDRKLRDFEPHRSISKSMAPDPDDDIGTVLRRCYCAVLREAALLFVHRSFFARAMLECPLKWTDSPFASSLLSAYASANTLLKIMRIYFERYSQLLLRQWIIWVHALTSAVIIGTVACGRGPSLYVAASALRELEAAVDLFTKAQIHPVPRRGLPFLLRLLEKGRIANRPTFPRETRNAEHELSILGGAPLFLKNVNKRRRTPDDPITPSTTVHHALKESLGGTRPAHMHSYASPSLSDPSSSFQRSNSVAIPQASLGDPSWSFSQHYPPTADTHNPGFNAIEGPPLHGAFANIDGVSHSFTNTPSQTESFYSADTNNQSASHLSFHTSSRTHASRTMPELGSTSWIEELLNITAGGGPHAQNVLENNNNIDGGLYVGGYNMTGPNNIARPEQGDDPIIADLWRSLMADSQHFGSEFDMDLQ